MIRGFDRNLLTDKGLREVNQFVTDHTAEMPTTTIVVLDGAFSGVLGAVPPDIVQAAAAVDPFFGVGYAVAVGNTHEIPNADRPTKRERGMSKKRSK